MYNKYSLLFTLPLLKEQRFLILVKTNKIKSKNFKINTSNSTLTTK